MNHAIVSGESDGDSRIAEALCIGFGLVTEGIILGRDDKGRW